MRYGLADHIIEQIEEVLAKHSAVETALVYGSRAKGSFHNSSDIDLALKGGKIDLEVLANIILDLDDLLLPYKFDVVVYDHINNDHLRSHIDRIGQVVWDAKYVKVK